MKNAIKVLNLHKKFDDLVALNNCSFEVNRGEIFGFLGPSGSGKTTTIKLLTGQLKYDHGQVSVLEEPPNSYKIKEKLGIMSDNSGLYENLSVYDNLSLFANIHGVDSSKVEQVLEDIELLDSAKKPASKLSKGMKQRLIFARTIIHSPDLLFLDEPTANLDPSTAEDVRNMIRKLNKNGTTIFLTTHNMQEADELCDRVAFLDNGHIIESGKPLELKLKYAKNKVKITYDDREETVPLNGVALSDAVKDSNNIVMIHSIEPTLKDVFLGLTDGRWSNEI